MLYLYKLDLSNHQTQAIVFVCFALITIFIQKIIMVSAYTSALQSNCVCNARQRQIGTHIQHT